MPALKSDTGPGRRTPGLFTMVSIAVAGLVGLVLGWRMVARSLLAPIQVPALVSGGLIGLALLGVGCAFIDIQPDRRAAAQEAEAVDGILDEVAGMAAVLRRRAEGR
jgi:hypothetical protein